jgi:hypothetical protein
MNRDKTDYSLLDWQFIRAMADNMQRGIKPGRKPHDWVDRASEPGAVDQYFAALQRHAIACFEGESECWEAVACNAMILAYLTKVEARNGK